ncbi:putative COMM domain-containing protein 4 [Hypsibius exemplaris]|uniref:COMM domain-containing protein 4 n=1 Tax=Hypsibius exemplaris TaxID=2072580 RepID=A0A1W0X3Z6_HYPEX|nr:putative COMM domain-containing protein 4 [Hypsibius exemplaris]
MKFKFCGDLDCPDWALAAISLLTKLTSIKMKQLTQEIVKNLTDGTKDVETLRKLCLDSKLSLEDAKIAIAAAEFFISNAVRFNVSPDIFAGELQQLGFPKEHATTLSKVYQSSPKLPETIAKAGFRVSRLVDLKMRPELISVLQDGNLVPVAGVSASLSIEGADHQVRQVSIDIPIEKFLILKQEVAEILHHYEDTHFIRFPSYLASLDPSV